MSAGEQFLIRMNDGPHPGTRVLVGDLFHWPLPDTFPADGGEYVKLSESQLPPQPPDSFVMRGAEYGWQPVARDAAEQRPPTPEPAEVET